MHLLVLRSRVRRKLREVCRVANAIPGTGKDVSSIDAQILRRRCVPMGIRVRVCILLCLRRTCMWIFVCAHVVVCMVVLLVVLIVVGVLKVSVAVLTTPCLILSDPWDTSGYS
eukprot:Selendium_serpulae@DN5491_c0_g1_i3.p3